MGTLDGLVRPEVILASNTSSLSVTELSVKTARPGRVVGVHFFNPAPVQKLVEVIRTVVTEPDVIDDVTAFADRLGKTPVVIGDRAGFIANALLFGYLNHAVRMVEQSYASREDIDAAMRFGCGYPMGPLALVDLIGLDTAYEILDTMYHQSRNRLHAPAPLLKQMITAGLLGRKSGRGFYTYAHRDSQRGRGLTAATPGSSGRPGGHAAPDRLGRASSGTGTMASGIVEVFARTGHDVILRGRSDERTASADRPVLRTSSGACGHEGQAHRGRSGTPSSARGEDHHRAGGPRSGRTWWSRRSPRISRSSVKSSRRWTRSAGPARSWRPPPPRSPWSSARPRPRGPGT